MLFLFFLFFFLLLLSVPLLEVSDLLVRRREGLRLVFLRLGLVDGVAEFPRGSVVAGFRFRLLRVLPTLALALVALKEAEARVHLLPLAKGRLFTFHLCHSLSRGLSLSLSRLSLSLVFPAAAGEKTGENWEILLVLSLTEYK